MCKSSTLVTATLAALVGATVAHVYLLSPEQPVADIASPAAHLVTIVKSQATETSTAPIEVVSRTAREVAVAQSEPHDGRMPHLFGPRGLPARLHHLLLRDASIDIGRTEAADRFASVVADVAGIACDLAWARPTAGAGTMGAAYLTLTNHGAADELVGASSPIAASAGVHETIDDNGVSRMRPVQSIALVPGKTLTFRPGGYHVMLMGLAAPLKVGDSFPLTLTFAHAQALVVTVKVQSGAGGGAMPGMH